MVKVFTYGLWKFIEETKNKNVYCFGAGKRFQAFIKDYGMINIVGVIDNFFPNDYVECNDRKYQVYKPDTFLELRDSNVVLLVTNAFYRDIIMQLDAIPGFDNMECYLDVCLRFRADHFPNLQYKACIQKKIPKVIHYCWFGGAEIPSKLQYCIATWKEKCPDYEIIRWDESNYDVTKNRYVKEAYEAKMWAFVSDYARADIIYHYGGIYLDTDVELIKPLDDMLVWDMYCGHENNHYVSWGVGFGACKGNRIVKQVLDYYEQRKFRLEDGTLDKTTCPVIQTDILRENGFVIDGHLEIKNGIAIFPQEFFSPYSYANVPKNITRNTYSIHHFEASWVDNKTKEIPLEVFLQKRTERHIVQKKENGQHSKFQIWECISESCTAGSKAPSDIKRIAEKCGFKAINIHQVYRNQDSNSENWSEIRNKQEWDACYNQISENAVLLLQHPFWQPQETRETCIRKLKENKGVKIISLVHDVEELRQVYKSEYMNHEFQFMLEMADVIIVHNERMREFFLAKGVDDGKLVVLELFDYLCNKTGLAEFEKSISIAGNLDELKSPYLREIQGIGLSKIHLYGPNYKQASIKQSTIKYHGMFSPEEIVGAFEGGFGLVWDGESVTTCTGGTGNYLRYNNPHKLSLYLAAGLPVFIWKEAAESRFVTENQLGFAVSSLYEVKDILEQITENEYIELVSNVKKISEKIRTGYYTKMALNQAEGDILTRTSDYKP